MGEPLAEVSPAPRVGPSYLARLLDVLDAVVMEPGLTLGEVSRITRVPASTAFRLVSLLTARGFFRRDPMNNRFYCGPRFDRLVLRSIERLVNFGGYQSVVDRLSVATGESASCGIVTFDRIVLVARREPDHPLRIVVKVGDLVPPLGSAMGQVIISYLPPERRLAVLRANRENVDGLPVRELAQVQAAGFVCEVDNFTVGMRCIAVPFFRSSGEPAGGLSVAGPSVRFTDEKARTALPLLKKEADKEDLKCLLPNL